MIIPYLYLQTESHEYNLNSLQEIIKKNIEDKKFKTQVFYKHWKSNVYLRGYE